MIDWNFLLILGGTLLLVAISMCGGYFVGKHNAYVEMMNDEMKQRVDDYRRQLRQLERNNSDCNHPDH